MPVEVIQLQECFRCGDRIVKAANELIAHNADPLCEPMIGATGTVGSVDAAVGRSENVVGIADNLCGARGYQPRDIAILARNHKTLRRLEEICNEREIPCHRAGASFDVCSTPEFKLIHAALRLCVNKRDDLAFLRLRTTFGLSDAAYADCRRKAIADGDSHFAAYVDGWDGETHPLADVVADPGLTHLFAALHCIGTARGAGVTAVDVFWFDHLAKPNCDTTIADALRWFALRDSQDDLADGDKLTLSTIHAAKGLEWPVVIIAGCNDGDLPSSQSLTVKKPRKGQKPEDPARRLERIAEERRVCYVAITRAQERAVMHWRRPEDQYQGDEHHKPKMKPQSRFLAESGVLTEE